MATSGSFRGAGRLSLRTFLLGATICPLAGLVVALHAQCAALGQFGIYDTRVYSDKLKMFKSFQQSYCSHKFETTDEAHKFGLEIGVDIVKVVSGSIGLDISSSNFREWQDDFCYNEASQNTIDHTVDVLTTTINPILAEALARCVTSPGLHAWVETGADPLVFSTHFIWRGGGTIRLLQFGFNPGAHVQCSPAIADNQQLGGEGVETACRRADSSEVHLVLNATQPHTWNTPSILGVVRPPPSTEINIPACRWVSATNVECGVLVAYGHDFVHNAAPYGATNLNQVEYSVKSRNNTEYDLAVQLSALEPRGFDVLVNNEPLLSNVANTITGSWMVNRAEWRSLGRVTLRRGTSRLTLRRAGIFPHLVAIRLTPALDK